MFLLLVVDCSGWVLFIRLFWLVYLVFGAYLLVWFARFGLYICYLFVVL